LTLSLPHPGMLSLSSWGWCASRLDTCLHWWWERFSLRNIRVWHVVFPDKSSEDENFVQKIVTWLFRSYFFLYFNQLLSFTLSDTHNTMIWKWGSKWAVMTSKTKVNIILLDSHSSSRTLGSNTMLFPGISLMMTKRWLWDQEGWLRNESSKEMMERQMRRWEECQVWSRVREKRVHKMTTTRKMMLEDLSINFLLSFHHLSFHFIFFSFPSDKREFDSFLYSFLFPIPL